MVLYHSPGQYSTSGSDFLELEYCISVEYFKIIIFENILILGILWLNPVMMSYLELLRISPASKYSGFQYEVLTAIFDSLNHE